MTNESPDASKQAGKPKQTEPVETMPRDVGEFVGTVAHEVQSIAQLARGLRAVGRINQLSFSGSLIIVGT